MPSGAARAKADVRNAFFGNADHGRLSLHKGQGLFHDGASFVQHKERLNAAPFQFVGNGAGAPAHRFFIMRKAKVNVAQRCKIFGSQTFARFKNCAQAAFIVESAAPPHRTFGYCARKGFVLPAVGMLGCRHHILVRGKHNRS